MQVFAKCNVCISAIQLFDIKNVKAFFLYKSSIFPILGLANIGYWNSYIMYYFTQVRKVIAFVLLGGSSHSIQTPKFP